MLAGINTDHAFKAKTKRAAISWQSKTRKALENIIGFQDVKKVPLKPKTIESVDKKTYTREKILITTGPDMQMPVYILKPKNIKGELPVVLAFHGHGYGVKDIVGLWEDGVERNTPDGYHRDFGVSLVKLGFIVAAPEISCFGERESDFSYLGSSVAATTCAHTAFLASHIGGSALGLRVHDGKRLVDYLETRKDVYVKRIGAMGISGGGMHTFFSTCLDELIKACAVSGYYCTFKDSILAMHHCPCNYVHGLSKFGEMSDLVGLIAPRPFLAESGDHDPIFPIASVRRSVNRAKDVYRVFGREELVQEDLFEGSHRIHGVKAFNFLAKHLEL